MTLDKLAIIGGGIMGKTIAKRLLDAKKVDQLKLAVTVRRAEHAKGLSKELGINVHTDSMTACKEAQIILLAVKPQSLPHLTNQLIQEKVDLKGKCVISIATGYTTTDLAQMLPKGASIVRAMPNTPCLVGAGMTALAYGQNTSDSFKQQADELFSTLGATLEIDEKHMDTVTGLSASGPAFAYVIIESLADGGVMRGLPRDMAVKLAAQTLYGSAKMVLETGKHPAALKDEVTTPAGCTIGALLHLEDGRIRSVLARGVVEAARIASELASGKAEYKKS